MKKIFFLFILFPLLFSSCKKTVDYTVVDKAIIEKYIADNHLTAKSTASGLYYVETLAGTGVAPTATSYVTVYYKGMLTNDSIFDQTLGAPAQFFVKNVISGWREGLQLMKKGGKIKLLIPSALGYGSTTTTKIPANSVLIFDVDLQDVQ